MQKILIGVIVLILVGGAAYAFLKMPQAEAPTGESPVPQSTDEWPDGQKKVALKVGESATVPGFTITLNSVPNDYRCAVDVQCIEAGAIVANVTFKSDAGEKTFNMPSDEVPQEYAGYNIAIVSVMPLPYAGKVINPKDYEVTFMLAKQI